MHSIARSYLPSARHTMRGRFFVARWPYGFRLTESGKVMNACSMAGPGRAQRSTRVPRGRGLDDPAQALGE